ncbi:MAG: aldo/keto reductase, partial [Clostridia bacterium]|nr:aldo/keto reductase [Clostridia bacterium]
MRFPKKGASFDMEEVEREIMYAIEQGVNYFDTAYIYAGSEDALGKVLAKNQCREKIKIASKLPHYMINTLDDAKKIFEEECKRLRTDYIDYYLMHMLTDKKTWERLVGIGILEWLEDLRAQGRIRKIGFSYHGNSVEFIKLLEAYEWEFCQIQ